MKNTLKKSEIFGAIFVMVFGTLMHFFYDWSGKNPVVALFAPYNESTWEHLKLLFFPVLIYSVFQYAYIGKQYSGYLTGRLAGIVSGALMIVIIFYTYMAVFKHSILWIDRLLSDCLLDYTARNTKGSRNIVRDLPDWYYVVVFLYFWFVG